LCKAGMGQVDLNVDNSLRGGTLPLFSEPAEPTAAPTKN
jgi:hypothetical protein